MDIPLPPKFSQPGDFIPSPIMGEWIHDTFLNSSSPLFNEDHNHLQNAFIGILWTNAVYEKDQRRIIGTAEIPRPRSGWPGARQELQICNWFGEVPDFIITIDASYWMDSNNPARCALIEHELYHCAQKKDAFGMPSFNSQTGQPTYTIVGHDVEEFIGVVKRYGAEATGIQELVKAANSAPEIEPAFVNGVCGSCNRKVA